jgi:hypothetical protein
MLKVWKKLAKNQKNHIFVMYINLLISIVTVG